MDSLIDEGFKFMILGMVTVFLFLILMVAILHLQYKIISKFFPMKPIVKTNNENKSIHDIESSLSQETLVAVITASINQYKNKK